MLYNRPYMSTGYDKRSKNAVLWIIGINVGVFIVQCFEVTLRSNILGALFTLSHDALSKGFIWTFGTYSALHSTGFMSPGGGFLPLHIIGNMLGVFFIGRILLPVLGTSRFLQLYIGSALIAGLAWFLTSFATGTPGVIGASGSVAGLLVMFACLYPNREIYVLLFFILPIRVKPKVLALVILGISAVSFLFVELLGSGSSIAHSAHLGGMLGGWIFYRLIYTHNIDLGRNFQIPHWLKKKSPRVTPKKTYRFKVDITQKKEIKAEVDRILDKINTKGFGSLTDNEKKTLDEARDILNRR